MLVMRRRAGESLLIGDDIEIEILDVGPTRVKLGIVAPPNRAITRKEVVLTRSENLTASRNASPETVAWLSRKLAGELSKDNRQSRSSTRATPLPEIGIGKILEGAERTPDMEGEDTSGIPKKENPDPRMKRGTYRKTGR
jgi:carbon storage regulator